MGSLCSNEDALSALVITPASEASQTQVALGHRSKLALVWRDCRESMTKSADVTNESSVTPDKRQALLGAFQRRYSFYPELSHQPIDHALTLILKLHARRSADFAPLSRVTNLEEGRDFRADTSTETKIGRELTLVLENSEGNNRKNSDYLVSAECFLHSVRILMFSYALVASGDSDASL